MFTTALMLAVFGGTVVAAAIGYGVVYLVLRKRRPRPPWFVILAEYVLTGWLLLYLFVTQVMAFGNGMGEPLNLVPLRTFGIAWSYGVVNAGSLWQFAFNIVMTAPLGLLLPVLFPRRFNSFPRVLVLGVVLALATELVQLVTGRHADIDDVIANTAGVLVGYSVYVLVRAIVARRRPWPGPAIALAVVVAVVLPFAAVVVKDAQDPFGHLYYGHLQPATVTVSGTLPTAPETSAVYRYAEEESRTELITRLQSALDITTTCSEEAGTSTCAFGASRLFVFPRNEWAVYFAYADGSKGDRALVPPEAEARAEAEQALAEVGIDVSTLRYVGLADFGDNFAHVEFAAREQSGPEILWGAVMVTIGENGAVRDISDRQHRFTWVEDVRTTSPQAAIATAQDVGVLRVNMSADVSSVEPSFSFNADTGYLVPTWQITGELHQADGSDMPWTPAIDARAP